MDFFSFLEDKQTQFLLTELARQYLLTKQEYLNLIDMSIYTFAIKGRQLSLKDITFICDKIYEHREKIAKNQNGEFVQEVLQTLLTEESLQDENLTHLTQFMDQGFVFHSFNSAFQSQIHNQGLVLKDKPWNQEEIEQVRKIFQKYKKGNVFGLYQGRGNTPIFFAKNLLSAPYYGLSSPTFFRKFIENSPEFFNVFLNRDYPKAYQSVNELCKDLTEEEKNIVMDFFQKYWNQLASDDLPCMVISTKEKLGITETPTVRNPNESLKDYYLRLLLTDKNYMMPHDIKRENFEILNYQTLSIQHAPYQKNK